MKRTLRSWVFWFALVCGLGIFRDAFYHLVYEPIRAAPHPRIGVEFETFRPLIAGHPRIGYLSDLPLDTDPSRPRESGWGDMKYAHAQYALAPTILAHADRALPLVLANFEDPARLDRLLASGEYSVVERPAPSRALLRRR